MQYRIAAKSRAILLSGTTLTFGTVIFFSSSVNAACTFAAPTGDDTYVCDSGISIGGLADSGGNNSLLMPQGGTGTINGNVSFGAGSDIIELHSGTISGSVDQGNGADLFIISGGKVTGNVQQGSGVDDFRMTGGEVGSLNQGDNLDTFFMSDGRIIDAFDDGDRAVMTGGRIGRVNMKLDDNLFDMSGGTIDRNLVTGFGNDTVILSGGAIGGNVSVSGGADSVTVTGGSVGGNVTMSFGTDTFTWDGGGIIYGAVDLGGDNDTATLRNLTNSNIGASTRITGGLGVDRLTFDNVSTGEVARFDSWETIDLTNDTELTFDGTLTLGDADTASGTLTVDSSSTLFGGGSNGGIAAFTAGQLANVLNAGRIDLTNAGNGATDTFTIAGNYAGNNGTIFLNTILGNDTSASDKLVISGGTASGTTGMGIVNVGGTGAATTRDGIMVIEAVNGGRTESGAFSLDGRVAAGAYEYYLFKGGISANTQDNWYLRSAITTPLAGPSPIPAPAPNPLSPQLTGPEPQIPETAASPPPQTRPVPPLPVDPDDPEPEDTSSGVQETDPAAQAPPAPPPAAPADPPAQSSVLSTQAAPVPVPGTTVAPPTPGATPVTGDVVPLYRVEVPTYSVVAPAAYHLALSTLGTFHERRGEQMLLQGGGYLPAAWGRVFGQSVDTKWEGTVDPNFDGHLFGLQAGQDLFGHESDSGHVDRLGLFFGYANMKGDVKGRALGWNDLAVGDVHVNGTSFGGYWTHVAPEGWYIDGVVMGTWFSGDASSNAGESIRIDGTAVSASLEGGYPVILTEQWALEPQAQLILQHLSLDDQSDRFSPVSFDADNAVTGRIGLRLQGSYQTASGTLQPYLKANLWHNFSSDQTVSFGGNPIVTTLDGTSLEVGGGITANLTEKVSIFATADYTTNLSDEKTRILEGNIGLRIKF
ncbi:autotransporter outer membrane beta-barrel domain-containing protein [Agrobacterium rhizogenes]|uniref:autotransporter family protein n=1 Tax=Rhizobium rhizogenes TaxID=359 RepID=UPI001573863F|nr:autotransporter outer membrane beta-barrel domain-containing protein [Rhizobium rhizogenes]NTF89377.1 autotransporter outer membrane beta-barrel domain-containing protein [Rhizobium rhizogenes]